MNTNLQKLAALISAHAPYDGVFDLRLPGVHAIRVSRTNTESLHSFQCSSICITAQGAKSVTIGDESSHYNAGHIAVYSIDVPIVAQITRATPSEPYLNLKVDIDPQKIADLLLKVYPNGLPRTQDSRALFVGRADAHLVDASVRLLELMTQPSDAELLGPLVVDEILIRLLRSPMGSRIAQIGQSESSLHRVAKAVAWLRANFDQPVNVDELAALVNMSVSSFHRQFKAVTSMSPLQ